MKKISQVTDIVTQLRETVDAKLAVMPERDKRALYSLLAFVALLFVYGVFHMHQTANKAEKGAMTTQQQLFWMRGQANNIKSQNNQEQDIENVIRDLASAQNININIANTGSVLQFSATHKSANVLGSFFARLEERGLIFQSVVFDQLPSFEITAEAKASY